jgi:hypothetical protein
MDKEEKTRAIIISGLCTGRTRKEIIQFHIIKKSTVYDIKKKWEAQVAAGGGQFMSETTKARRAEKAKKLLAKIKHPSSRTT